MKDHIECLKKEAEEICDLRKKFFNRVCAWYDSGDACESPICEFGDHVDIVKDLVKAEKDLAEACYFMTVVHAMHEAEEEDAEVEEWMRKNGYNHNHYKSSGRFASVGHGMRMGFPMPLHLPNVMRGEYLGDGYPMTIDRGEHSGSGSVTIGYGENGIPHESMEVDQDTMEHGRAYGRYRQARRHYTESHDPGDKKDMTKHAMDHFNKTLKTLSAIWEDVDPEMRKKMRSDLEKTVSAMPV